MRSWCIRFNFMAAILCAAIVGVTDCLVNNYLPTKNSIQQIHDGSSESRRLPIVVVSKQHSQQKRKIHLFMSEDDSRENEIRRKVIILYIILYIYCSEVPFSVCTHWLLISLQSQSMLPSPPIILKTLCKYCTR